MQTDKVRVSSDGTGGSLAMDEVERFSEYMGLDRKSAMRMRLLAEEMIGMVNTITGDFEADFWLEGEKGRACFLHLMAETRMNLAKKRELIDAASDKKNSAYKGFMGKIREMLEEGIYAAGEAGETVTDMPFMYHTMGVCDAETAAMNAYVYQWSLAKYRAGIGEAKTKDSDADATEAWDELEKSIVASIADDVRVGVKGDTVELVIEKRLDTK